jgi:hypothetical protein
VTLFLFIMVSAYNQFVSQHIRSMPGANQREKMRAVAAKWRAMKGRRKGTGLNLTGRGVRHHSQCTMGCKGKHRKGCGFWDDVWEGVKGAAKIAGPRLIDLALKRIGAGSRKKGKGAAPLYPGREGASGGRVRRRGKGFIWSGESYPGLEDGMMQRAMERVGARRPKAKGGWTIPFGRQNALPWH